MKRTMGLACCLLLSPPVTAAGDSAERHETACLALRNLVIDQTTVSTAAIVSPAGRMPGYCHVRAVARPSISMDIRLPVDGWNDKYYQTGCGAGCGVLARADAQEQFINAMGPGLQRGYATATSDGGHHSLNIFDFTWALHAPAAERDWAWRSVGETQRVATALMEAFYGRAPERRYFQGCSTGGRMAHAAALRYPEVFDGIISGAPLLDQTGRVGVLGAWLVQANLDADGNPILGPGKDALIGDEVLRQCDALDGKRDRIIDDPRDCSPDPEPLACASGQDAASCLGDAERDVVAKWWRGAPEVDGEPLYPGGIPPGSERFWWLWLTGNAEGAGRLAAVETEGFLRYMAFADDAGPSYSVADFDIERDATLLRAQSETLFGEDSVELSPFRDAGGKMIVWHGWADAMVPPYKTVEWYADLTEAFGGERKAREFVRLFMIPGMDHCGVLPGENGLSQFSIDPLSALEEWVENDRPPESIAK